MKATDAMLPRVAPVVAKAGEIYGRLWKFVLPHKLVMVLAVIGMAATAAIEGTLVWLLEFLLDDVIVAPTPDAMRWIPLAFMGIFIARGLTGFVTEYSLGWIGRHVISDLRLVVFKKFLRLPKRYFDEHSSGPLLSRLTYNVEMVAESVTSVVTIAVRDVLTVIAAITVMLIQSPRLTLYIAIVFPIIAVIVRMLGIAFRRYSGRIQDSIGEVTQVTEEVVRGNNVVKAFDGYDYEERRMTDTDESNRRQNLKLIRVRSMGVAVTQVVFGFGIALVIYMAGLEAQDDKLSSGTFISFFSAMMLMLQPVRRITNVNATLQRGVAAGDSLFQVIDEPEEADSGYRIATDIRGDLRFDDVTFSYGDAEKGDVLSNVSFEVPAGKTVAIVGHSGSGKSTLANLVPRFYNATSGTVFLDDEPVSDYTLQSLRMNIALVSQDVVLFDDTIANNIAYGQLKDYSRSALLQASKAAHVHEFASDLPDGLDTRVGDRGALLSGGQRQRIAIARALLKDAPVLILDEATSSLDTKSERIIQDALANLMRNRTTLVIAHRLSTVENADQILVLDKGRIVESGTHKELLDKDGHYAALYRMQFDNG